MASSVTEAVDVAIPTILHPLPPLSPTTLLPPSLLPSTLPPPDPPLLPTPATTQGLFDALSDPNANTCLTRVRNVLQQHRIDEVSAKIWRCVGTVLSFGTVLSLGVGTSGVVSALLSIGAVVSTGMGASKLNLEAIDYNYLTPLLQSMQWPNLLEAPGQPRNDIIEQLVRAGADVNHVTGAGHPVYKVIRAGRYDLLQLLCAHGADFNTCLNYLDSVYEQPVSHSHDRLLVAAVDSGNMDVLKLLVSKGVVPRTSPLSHNTHVYNGDDMSPLIHACMANSVDMVSYLLTLGVDCSSSAQLLTSAMTKGRSDNMSAICALLMWYGFTVPLHITQYNYSGAYLPVVMVVSMGLRPNLHQLYQQAIELNVGEAFNWWHRRQSELKTLLDVDAAYDGCRYIVPSLKYQAAKCVFKHQRSSSTPYELTPQTVPAELIEYIKDEAPRQVLIRPEYQRYLWKAMGLV